MSSLVGITGKKVEKGQIKKMLGKISHRGQGNDKVYEIVNGGYASGEIGLSPRSTPAGSIEKLPVVLLDGELYNTIPENKTNVEHIRDMYMKEGKSCFSKLDGIYSCVIIDTDETILFRDPVGSRPIMLPVSQCVL